MTYDTDDRRKIWLSPGTVVDRYRWSMLTIANASGG